MAELAQAWITISANTRGMQRDIRSAVLQAERGARVNVDGDTDPLRRSIDQAFARAQVQSRTAGRAMGQNLGREAGSALSRELKVALGAVSVGSLPAVATALTTVAGSLQQVTQAGLVLPGVLAGAGTSLATLKLGTAGVGDAMKTMWAAAASGDAKDLKKAAEALEGVSPNAKAAVTEVGRLHGSLSKLKSLAQDNMFEGTDQGLRTLAERTLPTVSRGLDQTSKAWGATFREVLRVGADSSTVSIVDRIFGNTADAQTRANRAIAPMVSALGELAATGTGSLPRIADGLTTVSERFNAFVTGAASDGRLHQWIDEGIDGVSALGRTTLGVGQMFTALTKAAGGGDGLLTALDRGATGLAAFMNSAEGQSKLQEFFTGGREQLQQWVPILQSIPPVFGSIVDVSSTFTTAVLTPISSVAKYLADHAGLVKVAAAAWLLFRTVPGIIGGIQSRLGGLALGTNQVTGQTRTLGSALSGMGATMRAAASANQTLVSSNGAILGQGRQLTGHINNWNNGAAAMARSAGQSAVQFGRFGSAVGTLGTKIPVLANMQQAFVRSATAAERFGRTAGTVSAAGAAVTSTMGGIGKAAGGVVGALGGPWGAALAGAGIAAMAIVSKNQKSAASFDAVQAAIKASADAQTELNAALMQSRGAYDDDVASSASSRIAKLRSELQDRASREGSPLDNIRAEGEGVFSFKSMFGGYERTQAEAIKAQADEAKAAQEALQGLGLTQQELANRTYGSSTAFNAMVRQLESTGDGGKKAASELQGVRAAYHLTQQAAERTTPGISQMSLAMQVLGDKTSTTANRTAALKTAIDALNPARAKGDAIAEHDRVLRQIADSTQEALDKTKGFGKELLSAEFGVSSATANGEALRQKLLDLSSASISAAAAGRPLAEIHAINAARLKELAAQSGITVDEITGAFNTLGGRDIELTARLSGAPETVQQIGQIARAMQAAKIGEKKVIPITVDDKAIAALKTIDIEVTRLPDGKGIEVVAKTETARAQLANVTQALTSLPPGKAVDMSAPGGQAVVSLLRAANIEVTSHNGKDIEVTSPNAPAVKTLLEALNLTVRSDNGKNIIVSQSGLETVQEQVRKFLAAPAVKTVTVVGTGLSVSTDSQGNRGAVPDRAHGAIVPMANGGLRHIQKPTTAGIYAGRGMGTIFAERETGGESYIPLAPGKRKRSTAILGETARLFGLQVISPADVFRRYENGGISVEQLKTFASGIQGKKYTWGGGGSTFDADCSGAQSTIANYLTGATGRFSTANQGEALAARGFLQGDPPEGTAAYAIGWVNGGPGGGHTAGTIIDTDGSRINVEMGGAGGNGQYGGQAAAAASFPSRAYLPLQGQDMNSSGGSGASDDSSSSGSSSGSGFGSLGTSIGQALFGSRSGGGTGGSGTSSKTTAATAKQLRDAQDKATDAEKAAAVAKQKVAELEANPKTKASALQAAKDRAEKTEREAAQAKTDLAELKSKGADSKSTEGATTSPSSETQSLGQGLISGLLQGVGLDGSVFSNPFEWPNVKSATAAMNYFGGLIKTVSGNSGSENMGGLVGGAGAGLGINVPNVTDLMKPVGKTPVAPVGPGMPINIEGRDTYNTTVIGMDPKRVTDRIAAMQNAAWRRNSGTLVR
ncbi:hypothetical protein [Tsukamurella sp. USMM236]|uniref:hypothetical protein n=1 Tax=Tsukamurella sp. USMM236 TaxID=3081301 RepID=UPI003015A281